MTRQEFHFIACTNHPLMMEECRLYINRLYVPEGCSVRITEINDAKSMCEGYNRAIGMKPGDAPRLQDVPLRIYLHQDTFILNRWFLYHLQNLFTNHPDTGMIGMAGTPVLHPSGIMWMGEYIGNSLDSSEEPYEEQQPDDSLPYTTVASVDGFLMATAADVSWREDLLDGFEFYDVSQCMEFQKIGKKIIVPAQQPAWCIHGDERRLSLYSYNRYRKIFLSHYFPDAV